MVLDHVSNTTSESHKLDPEFKGPYTVTKVLNYDGYLIQDLPDSTHTEGRYCNICSVDHIKPWCTLSPINLMEKLVLRWSSSSKSGTAVVEKCERITTRKQFRVTSGKEKAFVITQIHCIFLIPSMPKFY